MHRYQYLIIGGGVAADSALKGIRMSEPNAKIGLISDELDRPYNRPPLSKSLWDGMPILEIWRPNRGDQVTMHLGRRAVHLDPVRRLARDQLGEIYAFDKALLAVGGSPRRLEGNDEGVVYFRTLGDYKRLRALTVESEAITLVGAGLIGSELAACLRKAGSAVDLYCGPRGVLRSLLPEVLSNELTRTLVEHGVRVHYKRVQSINKNGGHHLRMSDGEVVHARRVVAGLGLLPNIELAATAGIACEDGIRVDASLMTSQPGIYAAGDCVSYWCSALDRRVQSQHEEHANFSGVAAGRAMTGKAVQYAALPYFYSRILNHAFEGIGQIDSKLLHHIHAPRGPSEATVYYLEAGRIVGVLSFNVRADLERATELIESKKIFTRSDLI